MFRFIPFFLIFFTFNIYANIPYSSAYTMSPFFILGGAAEKNTLSLTSAFQKDMLFAGDSSILSESISENLVLNLTKNSFSFIMSLSTTPFARGEESLLYNANEGFSDSFMLALFELYKKEESLSIKIGPAFTIPFGSASHFRGEGSPKPGLIFTMSGRYYIDYFFMIGGFVRETADFGGEEFSHEFISGAMVKYRFLDNYDVWGSYYFSTDAADPFGRSHFSSMARGGADFLYFKYVHPGVCAGLGIGQAPYTPKYDVSLVLTFLELF